MVGRTHGSIGPMSRALLAAALMLTVLACQSQAQLPGREARRVDLEERDMISALVEFNGQPVDLVSGPQFGTATLVVRFGQTRIDATGGCNWYGAEGWNIVTGRLAVEQTFDGTLIGCDPASESQDRWLVDFLTSGPTVRIDGERVLLSDGDNVVTFLETEVEELERSSLRG